jgi:phosphatidylglycerophosphatase C
MPRKAPAPSPDALKAHKKVVAFDFDGTLTHQDSFISFLRFRFGAYRVALTLGMKPGLLADYMATSDRGALKSRLLFSLLGDITHEELETDIAAFVTRTGKSLFRPDALQKWKDWAAPNVLRVIVTASPELLVRPFGALIGADRVIGTKLKFSVNGRLERDLDGANCRGAEKVRRLKEAFGESLALQAAYGDTDGDREMLAAAREGHYRVFKGKP